MKLSLHVAAITLAIASHAALAQTSQKEETTPRPEPTSSEPSASETAEVIFSSDTKYETKAGVPLKGAPFVCTGGNVTRVGGDSGSDSTTVKAGVEVAVTSVVSWTNTGFRLTCAPFMSFVPEKGAKYVVVNERIGGKGVSALWVAPARQTCKVSVYKEAAAGFTKVETRPVNQSQCHAPEV
jgi:hypothetical protein